MAEYASESGSGIFEKIQEKLKKLGIDIETSCDHIDYNGPVKCVVVAPGLKKSVQEMGASPRDQVVMVRIDEQTSKDLEAWVETGAVKSRSEAAALFIREGLKVRRSELEKLRSALDDVEKAREKLRNKAQEVFGEERNKEGGEETGD